MILILYLFECPPLKEIKESTPLENKPKCASSAFVISLQS